MHGKGGAGKSGIARDALTSTFRSQCPSSIHPARRCSSVPMVRLGRSGERGMIAQGDASSAALPGAKAGWFKFLGALLILAGLAASALPLISDISAASILGVALAVTGL